MAETVQQFDARQRARRARRREAARTGVVFHVYARPGYAIVGLAIGIFVNGYFARMARSWPEALQYAGSLGNLPVLVEVGL